MSFEMESNLIFLVKNCILSYNSKMEYLNFDATNFYENYLYGCTWADSLGLIFISSSVSDEQYGWLVLKIIFFEKKDYLILLDKKYTQQSLCIFPKH